MLSCVFNAVGRLSRLHYAAPQDVCLSKISILPKVLWINSEDLTDIFEGEYPPLSPFVKPFLSFQKLFLLPVVRCTDKVLEAADGIFQHREHKFFFRL